MGRPSCDSKMTGLTFCLQRQTQPLLRWTMQLLRSSNFQNLPLRCKVAATSAGKKLKVRISIQVRFRSVIIQNKFRNNSNELSSHKTLNVALFLRHFFEKPLYHNMVKIHNVILSRRISYRNVIAQN